MEQVDHLLILISVVLRLGPVVGNGHIERTTTWRYWFGTRPYDIADHLSTSLHNVMGSVSSLEFRTLPQVGP